MRRLSEAAEGEVVVIKKINGEPAIKQRLMDMGLIKGTDVKIERYAPLKDPVQISVKGYSLAIRVSECELIEIE